MFISILFQTLTSIIIILVIHNLYLYFKETLTTPKVKDLVNKPVLRYNDMYNIIKNNDNKYKYDSKDETNTNTYPTGTSSSSSMKNELKNYMKTLLNKKTRSSGSNDLKYGSGSGPSMTEINEASFYDTTVNPSFNPAFKSNIITDKNLSNNISQLQQTETMSRSNFPSSLTPSQSSSEFGTLDSMDVSSMGGGGAGGGGAGYSPF
jgi:hypothetical protein